MPVNAKQIIGPILPAQIDASTSSSDTHPASIAYVNAKVEGLAMKPPVRVAVATNINLSAPGSSLDSTSMSSGESFLAFGQTTGSQNGIYIWNGASTPATRRLDANASIEIVPSMIFLCQEGTYADKMFRLTTNAPITLDTTSLTFTVEATVTAPVPTQSNKNMAALTTDSDGDLATNTTVASAPAQDGYPTLVVGSVVEMIGNGVKTEAAYISGDEGTTARAWSDITTGDKIFWNGSIAGYELVAGWKLHLLYNV